MRDTEFISTLLRVEPPWFVSEAQLDAVRGRVDVTLEHRGRGQCPTCGREVPKHDHRQRTWRDLDLCQDHLYLSAEVPRVDCPEHGVQTMRVPWSEGRSEFTERFERLVIAFLAELSIAGVARRLAVSWDQIDGVMERAVRRGLERRTHLPVRVIGIDEKAVKRRHKYFTIVTDLEHGKVLWVGRGRKRETIDAFWRSLSVEQRSAVEGVAMDMWAPYFESTLAHLPEAASKIVFDKFHISRYLTEAVDRTRRRTMRDRSIDHAQLKGTKYDWLYNAQDIEPIDRRALVSLSRLYRELGRAWSIKESFAHFWSYQREAIARKFFARWYGWAVRSRVAAIIAAAKTLKRHFENILTYLRLRITNAGAESMNSKIQWIQFQAHGFRNEDRFERAIYFHLGGLDLNPASGGVRGLS